MKFYTMILIGLVLLFMVPVAFAGCASESYAKACASCSFDAQGKIDQSCKDGYKSSGTACVSTSYPIMAAKYSAGNCSQVDECASELQSCVAQYSTGNDSADCKEGSVAVCYSSADICTQSAAGKCSDLESPCKAPAAIFLLMLGGALFYSRR